MLLKILNKFVWNKLNTSCDESSNHCTAQPIHAVHGSILLAVHRKAELLHLLLSNAQCCWLSVIAIMRLRHPAGRDDSDLALLARRLSEMTRGSSKAAFDGIICWKMYWCTLYCRQLAQELFRRVNKLKGVVRSCKFKESLLRLDRWTRCGWSFAYSA